MPRQKAELEANQSSGHVYSGMVNWWHSNIDQARVEVIWRGILGLIVVFIIAHYLAKAHAAFMLNVAATKRASQVRREQKAFENQIKDMDRPARQRPAVKLFDKEN